MEETQDEEELLLVSCEGPHTEDRSNGEGQGAVLVAGETEQGLGEGMEAPGGGGNGGVTRPEGGGNGGVTGLEGGGNGGVTRVSSGKEKRKKRRLKNEPQNVIGKRKWW